MRIIDISPLVTQSSPVYPGDDPLSVKFCNSEKTIVSTFQMSAHLGAHIDAPLHLKRCGDVSEVDLSALIGPCQVMQVNCCKAIEVQDLDEVCCSRVLLKTGFGPREKWNSDFPSIDSESDENLSSHVLAIDCGMLILENLDLTEVGRGLYHLVALPLKIQGLEASPVRAVLIDNKENPIG